MRRQGGIKRQVTKSYPLTYRRGGWSVDILECEHAILIQPSGARGKTVRRCDGCQVLEEEKRRAADVPGAKKTLKELIRRLGGAEALLELLARDETHRAAKVKGLAKARAALAAKRLNGAAHNEAAA